MNNFIVKIQYSKLEKPHFFYTNQDNLKIGDYVIVTSQNSQQNNKKIGMIISKITTTTKNPKKICNSIIKKIEPDNSFFLDYQNNLVKTKEIFQSFKKESEKLKLKIKFLLAEFDQKNKEVIIVYCLKEKKNNYQHFFPKKFLDLNIKLYQINNRKRAAIIGGLGICGKKICCVTFLKKMQKVSIDKVKNQNLMFNTSKLTGLCGKLKCCLCFENEIYTQEKKKFPKIGSTIKINKKNYKIIDFNIINQTVKCSNKNDITYFSLNFIKNKSNQ